jgi:hypothetical protein
MRVAAVAVILFASATTSADRGTVLAVSGVMDLRFGGHTWDAANKVDTPTIFAGPRVTLTFEDPPLPKTPKGKVRAELRLVPELFAGTALGAELGEGYGGAGLRGEIHMAGWKARLGMYVAARGAVIGAHRNGEGEFAVGEYIQITDRTRFGWEGAAVVRPRDRAGDRELGCLVSMYVGVRL